jgi:hypothetical protein
MPIKKGVMVRAVRDKVTGSIEALASDPRMPNYIFDTDGEVLDLRGDYAFIKFGSVPVPPVWLNLAQLVESATPAAPEG